MKPSRRAGTVSDFVLRYLDGEDLTAEQVAEIKAAYTPQQKLKGFRTVRLDALPQEYYLIENPGLMSIA